MENVEKVSTYFSNRGTFLIYHLQTKYKRWGDLRNYCEIKDFINIAKKLISRNIFQLHLLSAQDFSEVKLCNSAQGSVQAVLLYSAVQFFKSGFIQGSLDLSTSEVSGGSFRGINQCHSDQGVSKDVIFCYVTLRTWRPEKKGNKYYHKGLSFITDIICYILWFPCTSTAENQESLVVQGTSYQGQFWSSSQQSIANSMKVKSLQIPENEQNS